MDSVEVHRELERKFLELALHRPLRVDRYEPGTALEYTITSLAEGRQATVRLQVEKFVGGGFAGQVYRVRVQALESPSGPIAGLEVGKTLALKILIPPTAFSRLFRDLLYGVGFQGPFQPQVNPSAARAGALWQKFIRRAAGIRLGDEKAVVDIYATLVDPYLGSCGELSEWVEGRTWRLEVDEYMDLLKQWSRGRQVEARKLGSPEYRAKYEFMHRFVDLLHEIGAHEFARQYEWSTWKSQPNCLKRQETEGDPTAGLVAVDFRPGLVLLPFLPMSPGDFKLIVQGMRRGSLVQFDRGDVGALERFIAAHSDEFADLQSLLEELKEQEQIYRESLPDITHHHFRLFSSSRLWSRILDSFVTGWRTQNLIDAEHESRLRGSRALRLLFYGLSWIPLMGRFGGRVWGQPCWREHYRQMITRWDYLRRAVRGRFIERIIGWHRSERVEGQRALTLAQRPWLCLLHLLLSWLPAGLHRFLTDWKYARERLYHLAWRPVRLYFDPELRAQWLRDMVAEGQADHLLTDEDAQVILSQIEEPFIQKYLQSLAVHICTVPVTQLVSITVALLYIWMHPELPRAQAYAMGAGIFALFQVVPISPGSLLRGLYVVYLVLRERNFRDYNIALFLGFFKYIGYLAFPIQMAYRYPALARFMAGHWATGAVHAVPVFGERGALLEHQVFSWFYNWPLTIRRRMRKRAEFRATMPPRYGHIPLIVLAGSALLGLADGVYLHRFGELPSLKAIWPLAALVPLISGARITLGAAGASLGKRVMGSLIGGSLLGIGYTLASAWLAPGNTVSLGALLTLGIWRVFLFALLSVIGALGTEVRLPDPEMEEA